MRIATRNGEPAYLRAPQPQSAPFPMREWLSRQPEPRRSFWKRIIGK